jgi:hypothetical protein
VPLAHERCRGRPVAAVVALAVAAWLACAQRVSAVVHCAGGAVHDLDLPLVPIIGQDAERGVALAGGLLWGLLFNGVFSSQRFFSL